MPAPNILFAEQTMKTCRVILLCLMCWVGLSAQAGELADTLRSPRQVLLMRHAYAPGVGDPLDAQGLAQATRTGLWLKRQGVDKAWVFSSVWCRCRDTAGALDLGSVTTEASLASFFDRPEQAGPSNEALTRFIARMLPGKGERALILVTHHVNIRAFAGRDIGSGDMLLVQVDAQGRAVSHTHIPSPP